MTMQKIRGFEVVVDEHRQHRDVEIQLPTRGTKYSSGYDFYSPADYIIPPNQRFVIPTDIKSYMQDNETLKMYIRSSIGIKKGLVLSNNVAIIDKDYYGNPNNDGNIGIAIWNPTNEILTISKGERIAQGIFVNYLIADNGNLDNERIGGVGSTGQK